MLWAAVHLPALALEVFARDTTPRPLVVSEGQGRAQRVFVAGAALMRRGVRPGMALAAAHALVPALQVRVRDCAAEQAVLDRLAAWAGQFTPAVAQEAGWTLLLEVQGSLKLFGGHEPLLAALHRGLDALGYSATLAVAPTPLAAGWLARAGRGVCVTEARQLRAALAPLPVACLAPDAHRQDLLHGMGVTTLGDCLRLPRDGLARRLGPGVLEACDRALGRAPDPRRFFTPPARYQGRMPLAWQVDGVEGLLFPLHRLILELAGVLASRGMGACGLTVTLRHDSAPATRFNLALVTPSRDAQHLMLLVRERLQRLSLPAPVEEIVLDSDDWQPVAGCSLTLFASAAPAAGGAALIERLRARLGREAVRGLAGIAEHRPERAWRYCELAPAVAPTVSVAAPARRPLWLLPEPLALTVRDGRPHLDGALQLEAERERIESGWWDGGDVARDYFVAVNPQGARFWVFRELNDVGRWFVHGIFS